MFYHFLKNNKGTKNITNLYFRILLENADDPIELASATDYRYFTPLHYAAKSGNEEKTQLILNALSGDEREIYYDDLNAKGHRLKTPLHKARSPKVVKLLLKYGADRYAKMMEKNFNDGNGCFGKACDCMDKSADELGVHSVFSTLLHRNDKAAGVMLDNHITTNGQELDSSDLLIVYDLKLFDPDAKEDYDEPIIGEQDEVIMKDEMAVHLKITDINSNLLMHPLSQVYLDFKWGRLSKYFWITVVQYALFLSSLTGCSIYQTWLSGRNNTNTTKCLENSLADECYLVNIMTDHTNKGGEDLSMHKVPFFVIYGILALNTAWIFFREFFQMCFNWPHYSKSLEDKMEAIMVILTVLYVIGVFLFSVPALKHLAAWSVFFAWIEMILLMGRFPQIGKYVQMFFIVSKILLKYLLVYFPAILAFSIAFYILLSDTKPFLNPGNALMKTMVMLLGELEYENNFMWESSKPFSYFPSTQILIMLFVLLGCIVIMNLLVGLAVDEIDVMREKGRQIRLEMTIDEIVRLEDLLIKKPSLLDCSPCCQDPIIQRQSVFNSLKSVHNNLSDKVKTKSYFTKVCVRPIEPRKKEDDMAITKSTFLPVYFYYAERKRAFCQEGQETGFYIRRSLVDQTMEWLKNNKEGENTNDQESDSALEADETDGLSDMKSLEKIRNDINQILKTMKSTDKCQTEEEE